MPSYLAPAPPSWVVIAATGFNGQGINPNLSVALGGIIACGLVYTLTGLVVMKVGTRWIERMMPRRHRGGGDGDRPEPRADCGEKRLRFAV